MISSDIIRGYNDPLILSLLINGDSYGYEISKRIKDKTKGKYIIKETTLYSTFNRLSKNGYIRSYPGTETFGKRRTYYAITAEGLDYYLEKEKEWEITKEVIDLFIGGKSNERD